MEVWHVLNRGVDKRDIVMDEQDRVRFIHDLFAMNDANYVKHISQPQRRNTSFAYKRDCLVTIHAFCLMNNHYHLLLSEVKESGISLFLQKFNMGYAKYFNEKYTRTGALWQGKTKKILIEKDGHYLHIPYYIHLNPLDYSFPEWRSGTVQDTAKAIEQLASYRWSSFLDYCGQRNFPSVIDTKLLKGLLGMQRQQHAEIRKIISKEDHADYVRVIE